MKVTRNSGKAKQIEETLEKLQQKDLSRDSIALLTARLIELENPGTKTAFESDSSLKIINLDGSSSTMNLHNMWVECDRMSENRSEVVARYVRVLASQGTSEHVTVDRENIIALIRDTVYREYIAEEDRDSITRHLLGDLWIIYAVDRPDSTDILRPSEAVFLGLDSDSLARVAAQNIERFVGQMEWEPYRNSFSLTCEDTTYASSVLLLSYVWEHARAFVEGDPVIAVPARDTVLITGSENNDGICVLREEADYIAKNGHHIVSESLLRWRNGSWELFS